MLTLFMFEKIPDKYSGKHNNHVLTLKKVILHEKNQLAQLTTNHCISAFT